MLVPFPHHVRGAPQNFASLDGGHVSPLLETALRCRKRAIQVGNRCMFQFAKRFFRRWIDDWRRRAARPFVPFAIDVKARPGIAGCSDGLLRADVLCWDNGSHVVNLEGCVKDQVAIRCRECRKSSGMDRSWQAMRSPVRAATLSYRHPVFRMPVRASKARGLRLPMAMASPRYWPVRGQVRGPCVPGDLKTGA